MTRCAMLVPMSTESVTPDLQADAGMLLATDAGAQEREYAWGQRAAEIRRLSLEYPELNQSQIARIAGCSHQRVSQVLAEFLADTSPEHMEDFRSDKASICEVMQYRMLSSITQDKLDKTSAVQLVTGAAILEDKIRLMRGQPTSIHVHALVDVLDAIAAKREAEDQ